MFTARFSAIKLLKSYQGYKPRIYYFPRIKAIVKPQNLCVRNNTRLLQKPQQQVYPTFKTCTGYPDGMVDITIFIMRI